MPTYIGNSNSGKIKRFITDGLVLYLDAGITESYSGTGTTWSDLSGNNYDASIVGSSVWDSGYGGQFDWGNIGQITQYIILDSAAAQATGSNYTMEYWMAPAAQGTPGRHFCSMATTSNFNYYLLKQTNNFLERFNDGSEVGSIDYTPDTPLQFCVVRNGSDTGTFYKNGGNPTSAANITQINAVDVGGWILNQEQDSLGGGFDPNQNFIGAMMIIRLYNRALSETEIQYNFLAQKGRFGI